MTTRSNDRSKALKAQSKADIDIHESRSKYRIESSALRQRRHGKRVNKRAQRRLDVAEVAEQQTHAGAGIACVACGEPTGVYVAEFDSFACRVCDVWAEGKCGDEGCPFCVKRPDVPSEA